MTIIGEAELQIRAVGGPQFMVDSRRQAMPAITQLGYEAERSAGRGKQAFKLMFNTIRDSSSGAFAPVTDLLSHVEAVMTDLHAKSIGLKATAAGAAGLGIGTGLQAFASKEQAGQQQLADAIANTGHVYEEYGNQIEKTVKHGEHFGVQSFQTMDILNRLTLATNDPAKALASYNVVLDMAATRHMSATRSAQMLASAYGGNTRVFRMFGLNVADQNKLLAEAQKADKGAADSTDKLKAARQHLADVEARIGASRQGHAASAAQVASAEARVASASAAVATTEFKHGRLSPQAEAARSRLVAAEANLQKVEGEGQGVTKLTVSQQIELRKAHEAVAEALKKSKDATAAKTASDLAAKGAAHGVDDAVSQLSTRLSGQASAAADTFSGRMRALGATVEDDASRFGATWGPSITAGSTALMALGSGMTLVTAIMGRWGSAGRMAAAANREMAATEEVQAGARAASTEATVVLTNAERTLAEVEAQLSTESPVVAAGLRAEGVAAATAAAEFDALAVSERAAGAAGAGAAAGGAAAVGAKVGLGGAAARAIPIVGTALIAADWANSVRTGGNAKFQQKLMALAQQPGGMAQLEKLRGEASQLPTIGGLRHQALSAIDAAWRSGPQDPNATATAPKDRGSDIVSELRSMHMSLLAIQHNTAKGAHNTHDLHSTIQRDGRVRFGRSPELATLG